MSNVVTFSLSQDYGYVVLVAAGSWVLTQLQSLVVGYWRGRAGVKYPQAYAEKAEAASSLDAMKFNCAQRAHMNTMEHLPTFLFGLLFSGISYPRLSASLGAVWLFGRVIYTRGYVSGTPKRRNDFWANELGTIGGGVHQVLAIYTGIQMVRGQL